MLPSKWEMWNFLPTITLSRLSIFINRWISSSKLNVVNDDKSKRSFAIMVALCCLVADKKINLISIKWHKIPSRNYLVFYVISDNYPISFSLNHIAFFSHFHNSKEKINQLQWCSDFIVFNCYEHKRKEAVSLINYGNLTHRYLL